LLGKGIKAEGVVGGRAPLFIGVQAKEKRKWGGDGGKRKQGGITA